MGAYNNIVWQLLAQTLVTVFLIVGVMGLATGIGLVVSTAKTVHIFRVLNRWISTRHVLKSVEIPRETERVSHRFARWIAGGFVIGGIISVFGLIARVDVTALSVLLARGNSLPLVAIALESVRLFLVVGSSVGVVVGIMLLFYPNAEITLEKYANMWVSSRQIAGRHMDDMHMTLDNLVEANPRPAGWIIACTSAAAVVYGLIMMLR
jgi:hypothetical protein